ncbi:hypothetical protein BC937DRAFT_91887 [Endogone sp. FLAS-F59071]|nr:hypothetical protein BC937DRAFT_91887 [Endogone sp. FLAS-F59071]|eukprot:RUS21680.1 hypothetical protein BC937DRAFT_91887 [Endogone sp. FLAS-F59071]
MSGANGGVDLAAREALNKLIVPLTTTGEWLLNEQKLKCISTDMDAAQEESCPGAASFFSLELYNNCLSGPFADSIRYSSLQLIEQLFSRSHRFRQLLADDYPTFLQLTVGIHRKTLPPPDNVAAKLTEFALVLVKQWYEKFGQTYKQLALGYDHLKNTKHVKFSDMSLIAHTARAREQAERESRLKALQQRKFERIRADFDDQVDGIRENLKNMDSCFDILVPKADEDIALDFDSLLRGVSGINSTAANINTGSLKDTITTHGLGSSRYRLTIDLSTEQPVDVPESADNEAVYENLREYYGVLSKKHMELVKEWLDGLVKSDSEDKNARNEMLKKVIDLRNALREAKRKFELLGLKSNPERKHFRESSANDERDQYYNVDDDDENIEFEEVPLPIASEGSSSISNRRDNTSEKEIKETVIKVSSKQLPPTHRIFPLAFESELEEDVTYARPKLHTNTLDESIPQSPPDRKDKGKEPIRPGTNSREELLKKAPVVEWGEDLYYWDKDNVQFNTSGLGTKPC